MNVIDNDGGDFGTFVSWSLIFTPPADTVSPCEEAFPDQCGDPGCFAVTSEDLVCHSDGTTFTWTVTGTDACTGGASTYVFTANGGAGILVPGHAPSWLWLESVFTQSVYTPS